MSWIREHTRWLVKGIILIWKHIGIIFENIGVWLGEVLPIWISAQISKFKMVISKKIQRHITIKLFIVILIAIILILFFVGILITLRDFHFPLLKISVDNYWSMFGGISIPLTVIIFLVDGYQKNKDNKKVIVERIKTAIAYFLSEIGDITEHMYVNLDLSLYDINGIDIKNNRSLYRLLFSLHTLNSLSNLPSDIRRNYVMRMKLNSIMKILFSIIGKGSNVTLELPLKINDLPDANKAMEEETNLLYKRQLEYLRELTSEGNQQQINEYIAGQLDQSV